MILSTRENWGTDLLNVKHLNRVKARHTQKLEFLNFGVLEIEFLDCLWKNMEEKNVYKAELICNGCHLSFEAEHLDFSLVIVIFVLCPTDCGAQPVWTTIVGRIMCQWGWTGKNNSASSNNDQQTCVPGSGYSFPNSCRGPFTVKASIHTCCLRIGEGHPICHHQCDHPPSAMTVPSPRSCLHFFCLKAGHLLVYNGVSFSAVGREHKPPGHTRPPPAGQLHTFCSPLPAPLPASAPNLPDNRCDFWRGHASFSPGNGLIELEKCKDRSVIKNQLSWVPVSHGKTLQEGRETNEQLGGEPRTWSTVERNQRKQMKERSGVRVLMFIHSAFGESWQAVLALPARWRLHVWLLGAHPHAAGPKHKCVGKAHDALKKTEEKKKKRKNFNGSWEVCKFKAKTWSGLSASEF